MLFLQSSLIQTYACAGNVLAWPRKKCAKMHKNAQKCEIWGKKHKNHDSAKITPKNMQNGMKLKKSYGIMKEMSISTKTSNFQKMKKIQNW